MVGVTLVASQATRGKVKERTKDFFFYRRRGGASARGLSVQVASSRGGA